MHVRARELLPGVASFAALTPTLPPATHTQSYALGERDVLLVEPATPYPDERREWVAWARGLASAGRRLVALFATHHHPDHVGGAAFFADALGLPIWAHEETAALAGLPLARALGEGDAVTLDGPSPLRLEVLHTPGHAAGHLCLFERARGALIVGDMVASEGTILIDPEGGHMGRYLAELERLEALGARVALPAHGEPIHAPEQTFRRYVLHRRAREAKILAALRAAGRAAEEALVPIAYDDTPPAIWPVARLSLRAHLLELARAGAARDDGDAWSAAPGPS